ncbi:beta strand repeat-containing protein [Pseudoalteromonas sp. SSM20]|uniref:beta strand repeat-containing protein n=1 Tax=Pseudoalteromonas sp. SSM20 TaxID=3139394 RepID=UPI003BAB2B07
MTRFFQTFSFIFFSFLLSACGGDNTGFPKSKCGGDNPCPSYAISLEIKPTNIIAPSGVSVPYTALATLDNGEVIDVTNSSQWQTDDNQVASISSNGIASTIAAGTTQVVAIYNDENGLNVSASTELTVNDSDIIGLTITPIQHQTVTGLNVLYKSFLKYNNGQQFDVTPSAGWSSEKPEVATIAEIDENQYQHVTAISQGKSLIEAAFKNLTAKAQLVVLESNAKALLITPVNKSLPVGTQYQYRADLLLENNHTIDVTLLAEWNIADSTIGEFNKTFVFSALQVGTTNLTASLSYGELTLFDETPVTVTDAVPERMLITPENGKFPLGSQGQYHAYALYSDGHVEDVTQVSSWQLADDIGSIIQSGENAGYAKATQVGTSKITAVFGQLSTFTSAEVTSAELVELSLAPLNYVTPAGTQVVYQGFARFTDGSTQDITALGAWSSSNQTVASIGFTGALSGIAHTFTPGTSTICIDYLAKQACTLLTVTDAAANKLVITPSNISVPLGTNGYYSATAFYTDGHSTDVTTLASWQIVDTTIATISNTATSSGFASSHSKGKTQVTAQFEGLSDSTSLTITDAALVDLYITPANAVIAKGTSQSYNLIGKFSDGSQKDLTKQATWQTSDNNIAYFSSNSIAFGNNEGVVTVTATVVGKQAVANLTVTSAELTNITVIPKLTTLANGHTSQLTATAYFTDNSTLDITEDATWYSENTSIASITASGIKAGLVTANNLGETDVIASYRGLTDKGHVKVNDAVLEQVIISPKQSTLPAGLTLSYSLYAVFSDGSSLDVTKSSSWNSSNVSVASVSNAGIANTYTQGITYISAQYLGFNDIAQLNVTEAVLTDLQVNPNDVVVPKGTTGRFTATAFYSDGHSENVTNTALWQSADNTIASIEVNTGVAIADNVGSTTISAEFQGLTATAKATVTDATLEQLILSPITSKIPAGTTQQYSLTGIYSDSSVKDLTLDANWKSSATSIASINNQGLAFGSLVGETTITASIDGNSIDATLIVTSAIITELIVTPNSTSLPVGHEVNLQAVAYFSDSTEKNVTQLTTWLSESPTITHVANGAKAGNVTALSKGEAIIQANYNGFQGIAKVIVTDAVIERVAITPKQTEIPLGLTVQYNLTAYFSDGTDVDVTNSANWLVGNTSIATVNSVGLVDTLSSGNTSITGSYQGLSDNANLTVINAIVTGLQVSPATVTVPLGTKGQYIATAFYSDGHSEDVTTSSIWQSENVSIAQIEATGSNAGFASSVSVGTTKVNASFDGMSNSADVIITDAELVEIKITPIQETTYVGGEVNYTAFGIFSDATSKDLTTQVTWFSDSDSVASIKKGGIASGISEGNAVITASLSGITSNDAYLSVGPAIIERLVVYPTPQETPAGTEIQFKAHAYFSDSSNVDVTTLVTWQSLEQSIAVHNGNGLFATLVEGVTTVQADYQGLTSTGELIVTAAIIESLTISPVSAELNVSETKQFKTFANFSNGTSLEVTNSSNWQIIDTSIATVSPSGLVTANQQGSTQVQAEYNGEIVLADITVTGKAIDRISVTPFLKQINEGETFNFQAQAIHPDGSFTNVTTLATWQSDNTGVATVITSGADGGLATGNNDGVARISATYAGLTGNGQLTVLELPPQLTGLLVEPADSSVYINDTRKLTAYAVYDNDVTNLVDVTNSSDWTIDDGSLAFISTPGLVNGTAVGKTQVTATYQGVSGAAMITVLDDPIEYLEVSPNHPEVPVETIGRFTVIAAYVSGNIEDVTEKATWSSSDASVVSIVPTGVDGGNASALKVGESEIKASFKGAFDTTMVTVTGPTLSNVYIDPSLFSVHVSADGKSEVKAKAYAEFSDGNTIDVTLDGQWRMADESIASVNTQGPNIFVVGVSEGNTQLLFNYSGMSDSADVEVYASELKEIIVTPDNEVVPESQTIQYRAKGVYANGTELDITDSVTWTVDDETVATVNAANGRVTTKQRGITNVIASANGVSGQAKLTVSEFSLYFMEIDPDPISMRVGQSKQLACYAIYALVDDTSVQQRINVTTQAQWALGYSSNIVELSSTGFITAKSTGSNRVKCQLDNGNGSFTVHEVNLTVTN